MHFRFFRPEAFLAVARMADSKLAKAWERVRRIRRRFSKGKPWILFPPTPQSDENAKAKSDCHPISTPVLALNSEVVGCVVDTYGPNPARIVPLQEQVRM